MANLRSKKMLSNNFFEDWILTGKPPVSSNPYLILDSRVLDYILYKREIRIEGTFEQKAQRIFEIDQEEPEWFESVKRLNFIRINSDIEIEKLYAFGALNGISFKRAFDEDGKKFSKLDIIGYIRFHLILIDLNLSQNHYSEWLDSVTVRFITILGSYLKIQESVLKNLLKFININTFRRVIKLRSLKEINKDKNYQRFLKISNSENIKLIESLYSIERTPVNWLEIIKNEIYYPFEEFLLECDINKPEEIIKKLEIIIPLPISQSLEDPTKIIKNYVRNNISHYRNFYERRDFKKLSIEEICKFSNMEIERYISSMSDKEIFSTFKIYIPYVTRNELVQRIIRAIRFNSFFFPIELNYEKSINKTTFFMYEDIREINFCICFGTINKFYTYEIEDLVNAFYRDNETGIIDFRRPDNIELTFYDENIYELSDLIKILNSTENIINIYRKINQDTEWFQKLLEIPKPLNEINKLFYNINEVIIDRLDKLKQDNEIRNKFITFETLQKELIREFLINVFYTSMYMRRWLGPGDPYPLREENTLKDISPDELVQKQGSVVNKILEKMDRETYKFCMELPGCYYNKGNFSVGLFNFEKIWTESVMKGEKCIRVSSNSLLGISIHFLRILFRQSIPDVDIREIDKIV